MKTVLKNCRVLGTTHDKDMLHDIYVENGIIEKIGLNLEVEGAKQIDVGGHTVMSGLIDMHCNICDPGHISRISQRLPVRHCAAALQRLPANRIQTLSLIIKRLWNILFPNRRKNLW